jgi:hypothetical protein
LNDRDKIRSKLKGELLADPSLIWELDKERIKAFRMRVDRLRRGEDPGPPPKLTKALLGKPPKEGPTHLIIGDSHSDPTVPNHRYEWLGRMITDIQPSVVIDIGDFGTFSSLSHFDKPGSLEGENTRYSQDIDAYIDAQSRIKHQVDEYNKGTPKAKRYTPRWVRTLGNHEYRIVRAIEAEPRKFEGVIGMDDLLSKEFSWEQYDYLQPIDIDGVRYSHHFIRGGRAFGTSKYGCFHLSEGESISTMFGHTHRRGYAETADSQGVRRCSVNVGCYFTHWERYASTDNHRWWSGICLAKDIQNGIPDLEWFNMDRVQRRYS